MFCLNSYQHKTSPIASIYVQLTVNKAYPKCHLHTSMSYSNCSLKQELIFPFYKGEECCSKMLSKLPSHTVCVHTKIPTRGLLAPKPLILTISTLSSPEVLPEKVIVRHKEHGPGEILKTWCMRVHACVGGQAGGPQDSGTREIEQGGLAVGYDNPGEQGFLEQPWTLSTVDEGKEKVEQYHREAESTSLERTNRIGYWEGRVKRVKSCSLKEGASYQLQ